MNMHEHTGGQEAKGCSVCMLIPGEKFPNLCQESAHSINATRMYSTECKDVSCVNCNRGEKVTGLQSEPQGKMVLGIYVCDANFSPHALILAYVGLLMCRGCTHNCRNAASTL